MVKWMMVVTAMTLAACGAGNAEKGNSLENSSPARSEASALQQFEGELSAKLREGAWIVAIGDDVRTCRADELADFCNKAWLRLGDGSKLTVEYSGRYHAPISENVFSNFGIEKTDAEPAAHSSECLLAGIEQARNEGLELRHFARLFSDTTVFLGYGEGRMVTIDLADGSCFAN